ncbi:hypothetical protein [Sinomonas sp. P47F7]|uniref:hypothetical protein n=1 Tax=Sinomonas sp. P47F7 TaxID=3410987 RepID=UPI003BF5FD59
MGILIRERGGNWSEPVMGYASEKKLQDTIYAHPSLVTGLLGPETAPGIACREFQSGVGPADVVVLDAEGNLTLVECKLASNREVRREVIGQILDYASRIWKMSADEFEQAWNRAGEGSPFEALGDADGRIRAALEANLESARFTIVLAVDGINDDLRRIVEFLNRITVPETGVIVVEFMHASAGTTEVLIPTSFGTDFVETKAVKGPDRRTEWTPDMLPEAVGNRYPKASGSCRAFLRAADDSGLAVEKRKSIDPGCSINVFNGEGTLVGVVRLIGYSTYLGLELDFARARELVGSARARFEAFLDDMSTLDPQLRGKAEDLRRTGYKDRKNPDLAALPPDSVSALVRLIAEYNHSRVNDPG